MGTSEVEEAYLSPGGISSSSKTLLSLEDPQARQEVDSPNRNSINFGQGKRSVYIVALEVNFPPITSRTSTVSVSGLNL